MKIHVEMGDEDYMRWRLFNKMSEPIRVLINLVFELREMLNDADPQVSPPVDIRQVDEIIERELTKLGYEVPWKKGSQNDQRPTRNADQG